MIRLDRINLDETVESAHASALAAAETNIGLDICFTENNLKRHYTIDFISSFLDAAIDEDVPDGPGGWTLEQAKSHLTSSGFTAMLIDYYDSTSLKVDVHDYSFDIEIDDEGTLMLFQCSEYELGLLGQDLVNLMMILRQELEAEKIYERTCSLTKKLNQLNTQRQIIEAAGLGIIRDAFTDMEYSILTSRGYEDRFKGVVETDWGRININSPLEDLPAQIAAMLNEKEQFDKMLVTLDDEESIE